MNEETMQDLLRLDEAHAEFIAPFTHPGVHGCVCGWRYERTRDPLGLGAHHAHRRHRLETLYEAITTGERL